MTRTTRQAASSCGSCGATLTDGHLCGSCTEELCEALTDLAPGRQHLPSHAAGPAGRGTTTRWDTPSAVLVGGLASHLDTTVARLARIGDRSAAAGGEKPVVFHEKAAQVRGQLSRTLRPWALWLVRVERPTDAPPVCRHRDPVGVDCRACAVDVPRAHAARRAAWARNSSAVHGGDLAAVATYLLPRLHLIGRQEGAPQLHRDVVDDVDWLTRVIDRPEVVMAAGACGALLPGDTACQRKLYADPEQPYVTCPSCETRWPVAARRERLLASAEDALETAAVIATALTSLNQPVTPDRIYKWKERGRLAPHGTDKRGAPLYRLGDVVDLLAASMAADEARRVKAAAKAS